ncbi:MAG: sigma-70 factor domain-containing protein, partial [Synechococcaceae cyanobacterium]
MAPRSAAVPTGLPAGNRAVAQVGPRVAVGEAPQPGGGDLVRSYLRDIGRVPLLSHEQEITLGRQVQEL